MRIFKGVCVLFIAVSLTTIVEAQTGSRAKLQLAILPFYMVGIDEASTLTAESLFRQEIVKSDKYAVIGEGKVKELVKNEPCTEIACAAAAGKQVEADHVVVCGLSRLGSKIIVQYMLVDVEKEKSLIVDNTTSLSVEDLETVMKRVAESVVLQKPIEQTAKVGTITEKESSLPARRTTRDMKGFSFGYLYPQNGYDDVDKSLTLDFRWLYEMDHFVAGTQLAGRKGFAANVFGSYLFSKTDICPYAGLGFGFHWVSHSEESSRFDVHDDDMEEEKKGDGFELLANAGLRLFRTWNFQIMLNVDYTFALNDYDDQAIVFTIGLLR